LLYAIHCVTAKFNQLPLKIIKQVLCDFYDRETINEAKNMLISCLEDLAITNWNMPPKRRKDSKENLRKKLKLDIEDIMQSVTAIDDNNLWSKLPKFVTSNPDNLPSLRLAEGDLHSLMAKLNSLKSEVEQTNINMQQSFSSLSVVLANSVETIIKNSFLPVWHDNIKKQFETLQDHITSNLTSQFTKERNLLLMQGRKESSAGRVEYHDSVTNRSGCSGQVGVPLGTLMDFSHDKVESDRGQLYATGLKRRHKAKTTPSVIAGVACGSSGATARPDLQHSLNQLPNRNTSVTQCWTIRKHVRSKHRITLK